VASYSSNQARKLASSADVSFHGLLDVFERHGALIAQMMDDAAPSMDTRSNKQAHPVLSLAKGLLPF
jgi:hypothetical protein